MRFRFPAQLTRLWPISLRHTAIAGLALFLVAGGLYMNCGVTGCPDVRQLTAYRTGGTTILLDDRGEKFADLAPYERTLVSIDSLPEYVPDAFVAVEDRRFHRHNGVDWIRVAGAALANIRAGGIAEGFSTISMQLARNVFPEDLPGAERTFRRKIQEVRVAGLIEAHFDKRAILEMYLNHIYFGGGAHGIEAASQLYFGKPAAKLTLAEAATLAALPKAPSHYDPRRYAERSRERRNLVLGLMEEQGYIEADAAEEARSAKLAAREGTTRDRSSVPLGAYFIDVVRDELEDRFGQDLYRSRLRIYTTLNRTAQRAAEQELESQLKSLQSRVRKGEGPLQGAVVMMDARNGNVLALVGGRDPVTSRYNRAMYGQRQIGSAFKPFVYAAALDEGIATSQLVLDAPLRMELSRNDVWEPDNYDGTFEGNVSLREALVRSRNVPTVRLASAIGIDEVARTAREAGISATMDVTPALALGTVAMSPIQLATAYSTFATLGHTAEPRFVLRIEDENGTVVWEAPERSARSNGMRPEVAYIVTDMLRDAVDYGTGTGVRSAGFRGPVAGKTGTTNNATDAWFAGYTPEVVGVVWIGYDKPSPLGSAATGGGFAAPLFGRIMRQYYADRPVPDWEVPAGVLEYRVDPVTGYVLEDGCEPNGTNATSELFVRDYVPRSACPHRDWWGDFWGRLGGVFGRGSNDDRDRARPNRRNDDSSYEDRERTREEMRRMRDEIARARAEAERERLRAQEELRRERQRAMDDFMRERSERLRTRRGN